jgi:hypothetical protein
MKRVLAFAILAALGTAAWAGDGDLVFSSKGLGMLPVGTRFHALEVILRQKLPDNFLVSPECTILTTKQVEPLGLSVMLEGGVVTRLSVEYTANGPSPIKTAEGIGLGASEDEVKAAYGDKLRVRPNRYDPTWHYLVVDAPDKKSAVIFETNGQKVTSMRAGDYPSVGYTEGCR